MLPEEEVDRTEDVPSFPDLMLVGGIQGSGKTTLAQSAFADRIRINLDEIRQNYWRMTRGRPIRQEDFPFLPHPLLVDLEKRILAHHLEQGDRIVVDNTMIVPEWRVPYVKLAKKAGRSVGMLFLDLPIDECIGNNGRRSRVLRADLIRAYHAQRVVPTRREGYDALYVVRSRAALALLIHSGGASARAGTCECALAGGLGPSVEGASWKA